MIAEQISQRASLEGSVDTDEWEARVNLAAFYRLVAHYGMSDLIYNHILLRIPGPQVHFLVNPYGLMYEEITASSLHRIDLDGNIVRAGNAAPDFNKAGFVIHSAIHGAREDLVCVAHTHTTDGVAVSAMECGLLPISQTALTFAENLTYHEFEGFAIDKAERARLVADLGSRDNVILRNHGLLCCGRTIGQAFYHLYHLEMCCRAQVKALSGAGPVHPVSAAARAATVDVYEAMREGNNGFRQSGNVEWAAALRLADRLDPGFRR